MCHISPHALGRHLWTTPQIKRSSFELRLEMIFLRIFSLYPSYFDEVAEILLNLFGILLKVKF